MGKSLPNSHTSGFDESVIGTLKDCDCFVVANSGTV
jgi:hypothetical protein